MNVIFLDVDGVLNRHQQMSNGYAGIEKDCVDNLNLILRKVSDAVIVISSAWRYLIHRGSMTRSGLEYLLLSHGVECEHKIYGYTVMDEELPQRGDQILRWLSEHKNLRIEKYMILDDLSFNFYSLQLPFIQTDAQIGLNAGIAQMVIEYFNDKEFDNEY